MFEYKTVNQTKTVSAITKTPLIDVEHFLLVCSKNICKPRSPIPKTILHKINCNKFYDGKDIIFSKLMNISTRKFKLIIPISDVYMSSLICTCNLINLELVRANHVHIIKAKLNKNPLNE